MPRDSYHITKEQAVRAFRRLSSEDSNRIAKGAEALKQKTGLSNAECLSVLASLGLFLIVHDSR